jgi:cytochrome c-type biogenesis protein CcmH/NrfF
MPRNSKQLRIRIFQFCFLSLALLILLGAGDESARVNDLGHRMMCVCGCNQILMECNHVGCAYSSRMRNELVAAIDRGDNDDLVLQSFVQKYGTTVIAAPTTKGFNRVAWIMPYLALVGGIVGVTLIVRGWRGGGPGNGGGASPGPGGGSGTGGGTASPELDSYREQARKETEGV